MTSQTPGQALADIFERVIHVTVLELAGEERYAAIPWAEFKPLAVQLGAALLNAIEMRGYAVVPLEPTDEMVDAAGAEYTPAEYASDDVHPIEVYHAMIAARPR